MEYKTCTKCNKKKEINNFYVDRAIITKVSYQSTCKECRICEEKLPISDFGKSYRHKDGYNSQCKICLNSCRNSKEKTGRVIKRTPEYMREYNKNIRYKTPNYIIRHSIRDSLKHYNRNKKRKKSSTYLG